MKTYSTFNVISRVLLVIAMGAFVGLAGAQQKFVRGQATDVKKEDLLQKMDHKCPTCGGDLIMKFGRFGKFIACSNFPT